MSTTDVLPTTAQAFAAISNMGKPPVPRTREAILASVDVVELTRRIARLELQLAEPELAPSSVCEGQCPT